MIGRIHRAWREFLKEHSILPGPLEKGGYYIDSPELWGIRLGSESELMHIDKDGVLYYRYPSLGLQANPAYIAWYGLLAINRWVDSKDDKDLNIALSQGRWLTENAVKCAKDQTALRFEYNFNFSEEELHLKAPWPSAMAQGLAMSLLIRLFRISGDVPFKETALGAARLYSVKAEDGGVAVDLGGGIYFEEYPAYPLTLILDGTLFALLGLYDISKEDPLAERLFTSAIENLDKNWQLWDWKGRWSRYGRTGFFSSVLYHSLNCSLIEVFQDKGYLRSFPLSGWRRGLRQKKFIALRQMKRLTTHTLRGYLCKGKNATCAE